MQKAVKKLCSQSSGAVAVCCGTVTNAFTLKIKLFMLRAAELVL